MATTTNKNKPVKKKTQRFIEKGKVFVTATFNNTLVTVADDNGNVVSWGSTGRSGFSGSKKSTPYAATMAIENALNEAKNFGLKRVEVFVKGPGPGRDAALRVLRNSGIKVEMLVDVTPIPHNGTRPRKKKHG